MSEKKNKKHMLVGGKPFDQFIEYIDSDISNKKFNPIPEKDSLIEQIKEIVLRETEIVYDAGCDWYTVGNLTFIEKEDLHVSSNEEVANLVNAMNALQGKYKLINAYDRLEAFYEIIEEKTE